LPAFQQQDGPRRYRAEAVKIGDALMLVRSSSSNAPYSFGQPRSRQRRHRKHQHAAAVSRAFIAGQLLLGLPVKPETQAEAAKLVGSTPLYVAAAITLLEAEAPGLIESVVRGDISLLKAAETVRKRVRLVRAYREADRNDRRALGKAIGIDNVFDEIIAPSL
jgi:hypothetical protein